MRPIFFKIGIFAIILVVAGIVYLFFDNQKLKQKLSTANQPKPTEIKLPNQKEDKPLS